MAEIVIDLHKTYPFHSVSSPQWTYFPLVVVSYADSRLLRRRTYESSSLLEILGRAAAYGPRMYLNINPGLGENVLDLVNPRLQFSILEDGRGVTG